MSAEAVTTLEHNKALTRRWFEEVWNQSRRDTIFALFAPECVLHEGLKTGTPPVWPPSFPILRLLSSFEHGPLSPYQ